MSASSAGRESRLLLLIEVPAVIVTFVMMVHIAANALLRSLGGSPINHTLELTQYWYVPIIALLGFVAAQARNEHITADLIFDKLPPVTRPWVLGIGYIITAVVMAGFAWYGWGEAQHSAKIGKTAGVSTLISWPVMFLVPLVFASLTAQFGYAAYRSIMRPDTVEELVSANEADEARFTEADAEPLTDAESSHTPDSAEVETK